MMGSEDRFLAQNRPKIIVQALVFPYNRFFNQCVADENLYETNQVVGLEDLHIDKTQKREFSKNFLFPQISLVDF